MNHTSIYHNAIKPPKEKPLEENDSAQIVLSDAKLQWMQNPFTKQLFTFLHSTRQQLLEDCVKKVKDGEKLKENLYKAEQIQETIEYASGIGTSSTNSN